MAPTPHGVAPAKFPHLTIGLLGVVTIAAYGTWYYSFGVLLDPILTDTGWSEGSITATYSASTALGAILAVPAGRTIDRVGSRPALLTAAVVSTAGLIGASYAQSPLTFAAGALLGGASLQALAFYHVTQTTAVRSAPDQPAKAIAHLTVYGAFSSAIYLPLAAALVAEWGWRVALRALVLITAVTLLVATVVVREHRHGTSEHGDANIKSNVNANANVGLRTILAPGAPRRYAAATAMIGIAVGTVLVYQVPLMVGAGLPVATAAWVAGARGAAQITGRIPLGWILRRMEARAAVRMAFMSITVGVAMLAFAGNVVLALAYVAAAGFGIGATSPLQGIYADELFERSQLGESMGLLTMIFGLSMAAGPFVVGSLAEATGTRWWGILIATVSAAAAVVIIGREASPVEQEGLSVA